MSSPGQVTGQVIGNHWISLPSFGTEHFATPRWKSWDAKVPIGWDWSYGMLWLTRKIDVFQSRHLQWKTWKTAVESCFGPPMSQDRSCWSFVLPSFRWQRLNHPWKGSQQGKASQASHTQRPNGAQRGPTPRWIPGSSEKSARQALAVLASPRIRRSPWQWTQNNYWGSERIWKGSSDFRMKNLGN